MLTDRRIDKLERELAALEAEFRETLITALRRCVDRSLGLFGRNDHVWPAHWKRREPGADDAAALLVLGEQIAGLRQTLGITESFDLNERLLALRRLKGPNELGEAKLARQWLDELEPS